jgi:hypothetical protein
MDTEWLSACPAGQDDEGQAMRRPRENKARSPAREESRALLTKLRDVVGVFDAIEGRELTRLGEIERDLVRTRGRATSHPDRWIPGRGILTVLEDAKASDKVRRGLVRALERVQRRCRTYIVAIGDDCRRKGIASPLCCLPGHPHESRDHRTPAEDVRE